MAVQMGIETLFGLPAHPLVVHAAVVLVPLSAIGAIACLHPGVRRRLGVVVAVLACIGAVAVWIAAETGEALEEEVDETELVEEHAELGDRMIVWAALLAVSTVGMVGFSEYQRRQEGDGDTSAPAGGTPAWHRFASIGLAAFVVITAVGATVMIIDVGHTGAKATWSEEEEGGDGEERDAEHEEDEDEDEEGLAPLSEPADR